jgi:hypothetical protein
MAKSQLVTGAFVLAHAAPYYPPGTLHVVVVDPGVGTERSILAASFGGQLFLFPDNGVITLVAKSMPLEAIATVRAPAYFYPRPPSTTFHGRDVFAPVAGQILNGLDIRRLGPQPTTYKLLEIAEATQEQGAVIGSVIYVDHFGNCISNISQDLVALREELETGSVLCAGREVGAIRNTYADVPEGQPLALFNSMRLLEVSVNSGRACDEFRAAVGTEVRLEKR